MSDQRVAQGTASVRSRFSLVFLLAMTEVMPVMLVARALPVILRKAGASLDQIGAVYLVLFPWALKFLWAPLVDRFNFASLGRYRSSLLVLHSVLVVGVVALSCVDFTHFLLHRQHIAIPALAALTIVSATADTASHGLAVNLLGERERGPGNGVQTAGMMTGSLIGGGLVLVLVDWIGWQGAMLAMAGMILLPIIAVWRHNEPFLRESTRFGLRDVLLVFKGRGILRWFVALAMIGATSNLVAAPMEALLVDRGLELTEIGVVLGVLGSAAGIAGGLVGGLAVRRLGRRTGFYTLGVVSVLGLVPLAVVAEGPTSRGPLYAAVLVAQFGTTAVCTILYTMMMDRSRGHLASSDYTVQYSVLELAGFSGMTIGGWTAGLLGMRRLFLMAPLTILLALLGTARLLRAVDFRPATNDQGES